MSDSPDPFSDTILLKVILYDTYLKARSNQAVTLMMEAKDVDSGVWISMSNSDSEGNLLFRFPHYTNHFKDDCLHSFAFCLTADEEHERHKLTELDIYETMVDITANLDETECKTHLTTRCLSSLHEPKKEYWIRSKLAGLPRPQGPLELSFQFRADPLHHKNKLIRKKIFDRVSVVWRDTSQAETTQFNVRSKEIEFDEVMAAVLLKPSLVQMFAMSNNLWAISRRREHDWLSAVLNAPSPEVFADFGDEFFIGCRTQGSLKVFMRITRSEDGYEIDLLKNLIGELEFSQMHEDANGSLVEKSIFPTQSLCNTKLKFQGDNSHCLVKVLVKPKSVSKYPRASISAQNSIRWSVFAQNSAINQLGQQQLQRQLELQQRLV